MADTQDDITPVSYVLEFDEDDTSCVVLTPNSPEEFRDLIYNSQMKFVDMVELITHKRTIRYID